MTDETQTLTREVARCADLLARILDATTPARPSTPSPSGTLTGPPAPNDGQANTRPAANALGENAQTPQEAPVPAASRPHAPGSGTCGGRAGNGPQNATQCVWPTVPGWYWVRGVDRSEADPVEGIAYFGGRRWFRGTHADGNMWSIYKDVSGDRLDEAVPVAFVPTWLIEKLFNAQEVPVWADTIRDIENWLNDHEEARR